METGPVDARVDAQIFQVQPVRVCCEGARCAGQWYGVMKNLLKRLLGFEALPRDLTYDKARAVLEEHNRATRLELAVREDAAPEMLYYLSEDEVAEVRKAIAANPATPIQASERLADDPEEEVRAELARRIGSLVPGTDVDTQTDLGDRVMSLLEKLASDKLPRIRAIIAEEIKALPDAPYHIVLSLARDAEVIVCAPVLEYSPLLTEADLMELVAGSVVEGATEAIARRSHVSEGLASAIAETFNVPAVVALLSNHNAKIREDTLDLLISQAPDAEPLHAPLVMRPRLSVRAIRHIASFVARALLEELSARGDLDEQTQTYLRTRVLERIDEESADEEQSGKPLENVRKLFKNKKLDDPVLVKLADRKEKEALSLALSLLAATSEKNVTKLVESRSAEGVTALCWNAGLSMRTAHAIQKAFHIPHAEMLLPRGGSDYPLSEEKMAWQLDYFGIEKKV